MNTFESYNDSYTKNELLEIAHKKGIRGVKSSMRKRDIVNAIISGMSKTSRRWKYAAAVGVLAATVAGGISAKLVVELKRLEKESEDLEKKSADLEEELKVLKNESATLKSTLKLVKHSQKQLAGQVEYLNRVGVKLVNEYKLLRKNHDKLTKRYKKLSKKLELAEKDRDNKHSIQHRILQNISEKMESTSKVLEDMYTRFGNYTLVNTERRVEPPNNNNDSSDSWAGY